LVLDGLGVRHVICTFCGHAVEEEFARERCRNCALFAGCRKVRCPRCGYESPEGAPGLVKWLRKKVRGAKRMLSPEIEELLEGAVRLRGRAGGHPGRKMSFRRRWTESAGCKVSWSGARRGRG